MKKFERKAISGHYFFNYFLFVIRVFFGNLKKGIVQISLVYG